MVDRIRWDTVSYPPFYYIFLIKTFYYIFSDFQFLAIINNFLFTSQNIGDKGHTLKPGVSHIHDRPHDGLIQITKEMSKKNYQIYDPE